MQEYDNAVNFLEKMIRTMTPLWKNEMFPWMETQVEYAFKVLKDQKQYSDRKELN